MNSIEYDLFREDYKNTYLSPNPYLTITDNGRSLIVKAIPPHKGVMTIDCTSDQPIIDGEVGITFDNHSFIDYTQTFKDFGFPGFLDGLTKFFNIKAKIEIMPDNIYLLTIGGDKLEDSYSLLCTSSLDNYFKDIDLYMTDINLRRSNVVSNLEKLSWYATSVNYMQTAGKSKLNKIKPYNLTIIGIQFDNARVNQIAANLSDAIFLVDTVTLNDCSFATDEVREIFMNLFRGTKFY